MENSTNGTSATTEGANDGANVVEQVTQKAQQAVQQTSQFAGQAMDQVKSQVQTQASSQKDRAVDTLGGMAQALHKAGQQISQDNQPVIGGLLDKAGSQIDQVSGYLRDRDVNGLVQDAENLARTQPALFLGGAFVLGLALARFLKSSGSGSVGATTVNPNRALVPIETYESAGVNGRDYAAAGVRNGS